MTDPKLNTLYVFKLANYDALVKTFIIENQTKFNEFCKAMHQQDIEIKARLNNADNGTRN